MGGNGPRVPGTAGGREDRSGSIPAPAASAVLPGPARAHNVGLDGLESGVAISGRGYRSMKFLEGAPLFAAEVRSEGDYGPVAEEKMAEKLADYFAAGTLVVWDVDLLSENVVKVYRASDPFNPTIYHRGEVAEAEPAAPGWSMPVDDLFE